MATKSVDLKEIEQHPRRFFDEVGEGEEIIVNSDGQPIARIMPTHRLAGLHRGKVRMSEDFDEPLGLDFWLGDDCKQ